MKKTRFATTFAAAAFAVLCHGQETSAPQPAPAEGEQQAATNVLDLAGARARLAELKSLRTQTTQLCGTSLQFPFYHFAVLPSHSPREVAERWRTDFPAIAPRAFGDAALAAELFAGGADLLADLEDGEDSLSN